MRVGAPMVPSTPPSELVSLELRLARISADEMVAALGLSRAPSLLRAAARAAFSFASAPMGRVLSRFDERIASRGIAEAAAAALVDLNATWTSSGRPPSTGPLLVVANHPGAYDALVLLAATGRTDVAIVAADRDFLNALPSLARHLVIVPDGPSASPRGRALGVRRALRHLRDGGALFHFGAGHIEPDPAFVAVGAPAPLDVWQTGTGALVRGAARVDGVVVAAVAEAVHSARAKRLLVNRLAERHGVTTLAPLLQIAVPAYRDVRAHVRFSTAVPARSLAVQGTDAEITARVRDVALRLLRSPPA
jgi:hypothetical protein